jgi:hypothetical protein
MKILQMQQQFHLLLFRLELGVTHSKVKVGDVGLELGAIWGGQPLNVENFNSQNQEIILCILIKDTSDNWGAKAKITYSNGPFNWYSQGAAMGLLLTGC